MPGIIYDGLASRSSSASSERVCKLCMAAAWNGRKAFAGDALRLTFDRGSAAESIWERLPGGPDRLRGHPAGCISEGPQTGQHQHPRRNSQRSVSTRCDTRKPPA